MSLFSFGLYDRLMTAFSDVPNSGRKLVTLPKRMAWDALLKEHIRKLDEKKPVIYCGDLNVSHKEIGIFILIIFSVCEKLFHIIMFTFIC